MHMYFTLHYKGIVTLKATMGLKFESSIDTPLELIFLLGMWHEEIDNSFGSYTLFDDLDVV